MIKGEALGECVGLAPFNNQEWGLSGNFYGCSYIHWLVQENFIYIAISSVPFCTRYVL